MQSVNKVYLKFGSNSNRYWSHVTEPWIYYSQNTDNLWFQILMKDEQCWCSLFILWSCLLKVNVTYSTVLAWRLDGEFQICSNMLSIEPHLPHINTFHVDKKYLQSIVFHIFSDLKCFGKCESLNFNFDFQNSKHAYFRLTLWVYFWGNKLHYSQKVVF